MEYYGEADTQEEVFALCNRYLDDNNYDKYGYRRWLCDKTPLGKPLWIVDFGSWNRFFYIYDLNGQLLEDWNKLNKGNKE